MKHYIYFSITLIAGLFSVAQNVFALNPGDVVWQVDVPDNGYYSGHNLDSGSSRYIFTAVTADSNYVYTGRGYKGSWTSTGGGSIQRWSVVDGSLVDTTFTCGCLGVYSVKLQVYNGDGLGLTRLYVYKPTEVEIHDKTTLALIATISDSTTPLCSGFTSPSTACNDATQSPAAVSGSVGKRSAVRSDGLPVSVEHTGTYGVMNPMTLYMGGTSVSDTTWKTDIIPAPAWNTSLSSGRYFGAEAIVLAPTEDYVYIVGGREKEDNTGVYYSRIQKRALPSIGPTPVTVSLIPTPTSFNYGGGNVSLSWSASAVPAADSCDVTSSPFVWSGTGLPISGTQSPIPIAVSTTFTATCTRNSDGATGTDSQFVAVFPNSPPVAVVSSPATDIAITSGTNVSFDGTGSYDPDGSIVAYRWREGDCATGTLLSSASTFSKNDFTLGSHPVYLTVQDNNAAWSSCVLRTITMPPQCSDGIDNDHDGVWDSGDPGCWTNPLDSTTYNQNDNDENNCGNNICEKTAGESFNTCRLDCKIIFKEN